MLTRNWKPIPPAMMLLLPLLGCAGEPYRPAVPGTPRGDCYDEAESWGEDEVRAKCAGYQSTDECPAYPGINEEITKRQEACPS